MNAPLTRFPKLQRNDVLRQAMIDAGVIRPALQPYDSKITPFRNAHNEPVLPASDPEIAAREERARLKRERRWAARRSRTRRPDAQEAHFGAPHYNRGSGRGTF